MTDSSIDALIRAARRVAAGEPLTTELMADEAVPAALRLVIAAVTLTAADQPVNKKAITTAAPTARSATYRDHSELLEAAKDVLPAFVQAQLALVGSTATVSSLAADLENAYRIIRDERSRRVAAEERLAHVASYARELHAQLKPERDALLRERAEKVRTLRPVASLEEDRN